LKLGGLPPTIENLKYAATSMISPGKYRNLHEMLLTEKRERIKKDST
jgi:hypothetical protein